MTPAQYRALLDAIMRALRPRLLRSTRQVLASTADPAERADRIAAALIDDVRAGRERAHERAGEFIDATARASGVRGAPYVPPLDGYAEEAIHTVVEEALKTQDMHDLSDAKVADNITATLVRHTENAARQTVTRSVEDSDAVATASGQGSAPRAKAWARQLTGADNCYFCVMLASRGAVYRSRRAALFDDYLRTYHDHCDCMAVPIFDIDRWDGKAEADRLYQLYLTATKGSDNPVNALRRHLHQMAKDGEQIAPDLRAQ